VEAGKLSKRPGLAKVMKQTRLLPAARRRNIAAEISSVIAPATGRVDFDHLHQRMIHDCAHRVIATSYSD
jgi:hypothetical protein